MVVVVTEVIVLFVFVYYWQTLRAIVQKSLHKVVETEGCSIAFPIIGTGILNFPPNASCRIMLDESLEFCQKNPRSCLKDIRFIVFHQNQTIIEAFRQEISIVQEREGKLAIPSTRVQNNNEMMSCLNIEVIKGDLTHEKTDPIVNMIGQDMDMNNAGELSKSIALASGPQVQLECSQVGQQAAGSAVITTAGNLPANHVIHLVPGLGSIEENIFTCLENCLQLAETRRLRSISFPAVGTGRYGIEAAASASIIFKALKNFERRFFNIRHVRIVIPQFGMIKAFLREKKIQPIHISRPPLVTAPTEESTRVGIEIISGDLTRENTDAIVNIINTDMTMSNARELSKAIASAGGQQVEDECKRLGPQRGGSAVVTNGGDLKARYIIHLIPISSDKQHLQKCLEEGLRLADARGFHSISVPAIGTGGYGMSAVVSANMIFRALGNVCKKCLNIQRVRIVVLNQQLIEAFKQEQKRQNVYLHRFATQTIKQTVRVWVTGNDEESVSKAVDAIKSGFSDDCLFEEVKDEGVSILSESQVTLLVKESYKRDVEMTIDANMNRITLRGDEREVPKMASKIFQEISQRKKELEEQQEHENAIMVAKTIDWAYELNGAKTHFDLKTNYLIEMAHSKEQPSVKVSLQGDDFVIDLEAKMGYGQHNGEQLALIRKLKQAEGNFS